MELHLSAKIDEAEFKKMRKDDDRGASTQELIRLLMSGNESDNPVLMLLPESATKLTGPKEYSLKLTFTLPVKDENISPPSNVRIARDFGDYEAATSWEGHTLHASWRLSFRFPEFKGSQIADYRAFRQEIVESLVAMAGKSASGKKSKKSDRNKVVATLSPPVAGSAPLRPSTSALYSKAQTAIEARNWGNAERDLEAVVKEAPDFEYGWSNLGRTRMALHKYADAEVAFRKYLELAPNLSTPYLQLASALSAQEKYPEAAEVLEKDVAKFPKDAQALRLLGSIHLRTHQTELAVHDLETATSLFPQNAPGQLLLGSAYLDANHHDKGAAAFERAVSLDQSDTMLNSTAYRLAEAKTHLDRAEGWSARSISQVELELNQVTLQSVGAKSATLAIKVASYWDTMGWIKFQKNDIAAAEKYIRAAWELSDSTTIGAHLGRIYETQGNKDKAIEAYAQTLASVTTTQATTPDEQDAKRRLSILLGNESLVDARINESKPRVKERRSVQVENSAHAEGIAQYIVIIGPGSKLTAIQATSPDNQLDGLTGAIRATSLPQSFPDDTILKLPRTAVLACVRTDQPCKFSLLSAGSATRVFPEEQTSLEAGIQ